MRKLKRLSLLTVLALVMVGCYPRGITVTVANDSSSELLDVALKYRKRGAEAIEPLGTIRLHASKSARLVNDAESSLILTFRDAQGTHHNEQIDIYLEGSHSPVTLHVTANYLVRCEGRCR